MKKTLSSVVIIVLFFIGMLFLLKGNNNQLPRNQQEYEALVSSRCSGEPACMTALIWNDEMETGDIKTYAEQTQFSIYAQQAKSISNENLIKEIKDGLKELNTLDHYVTNLGLQMSADIRELEQNRHIYDKDINNLMDETLNKWSPCWGIPYGQCKE